MVVHVVPCRRVFIRDKPREESLPARDLRCGSGALNRAGVESPRKGAHLFRHSLAMTMIRQAASLVLLCYKLDTLA
jgi:hypothetical protein